MGGVARRASLIETIRKRTLMCYYLTPVIFFRGLFNYYGGELEFKLMSMMQYDASIGNHDFDNGVEVYMRKCLMPNLNSYRPIMTLKYDHGRPGKTL
jgi:2',3'-cyclic-nucleotide 2'-phosphodiesterase (5'-nucleotidase family)